MTYKGALQAQFDLNAMLHIINDCGGSAFSHDREQEMAERMSEYLTMMTQHQRNRLVTAAILELAKYLEHFEVDITELIKQRSSQIADLEVRKHNG